MVQEPGSFVVTFPQAYHAGFSTGFSIGEAINLGLREWWPYAEEARLRYKRLSRMQILEHERLLCRDALALYGACGTVQAAACPEMHSTGSCEGCGTACAECACCDWLRAWLHAVAASWVRTRRTWVMDACCNPWCSSHAVHDVRAVPGLDPG